MKFSKIALCTMAAGSAFVVDIVQAQGQMVKMCLFYDSPSGHARSDPIINQQCASGHVHTFYGPLGFHPNTTYEDLINTPPELSTSPVEENQSLYWHPSIYEVTDSDDGTETFTRVSNLYSSPYYRWDNSVQPKTEAYPPGFRMIASTDDFGANSGGEYGFNLYTECCDYDVNGEEDCQQWDRLYFPQRPCASFGIAFAMPTCWDGTELGNNNNHKDHMRYTENGEVDGDCPTDFNHRVPQIQLFVRIPDYKGGKYQLSDGRSEYHVDFFNGWQEGKLQEIIDGCPVSKGQRIGAYNPPCNCAPHEKSTVSFVTENSNVPEPVCDDDVRRLIIDEVIDVTTTLPLDACQGPPLIKRSWDQLSADMFICNAKPIAQILYVQAESVVEFNGGDSYDSDGIVVSYQWNFGDGSGTASGKIVDHEYSVSGVYKVLLTVRDNEGTEDVESVTLQVGNGPEPFIQLPGTEDKFEVGQSFTLMGYAIQDNGEKILSENLKWDVFQWHGNLQTHDFGTFYGNEVTVANAPSPEDPFSVRTSRLEIRMTATDSNGLSSTVSQEFWPMLADMSFTTDPPGLELLLMDYELSFDSPTITLTTWVGHYLFVEAPKHQIRGDYEYEFESWSDGGARKHTVHVDKENAPIKATYKVKEVRRTHILMDRGTRLDKGDTKFSDTLVYSMTLEDDCTVAIRKKSNTAVLARLGTAVYGDTCYVKLQGDCNCLIKSGNRGILFSTKTSDTENSGCVLAIFPGESTMNVGLISGAVGTEDRPSWMLELNDIPSTAAPTKLPTLTPTTQPVTISPTLSSSGCTLAKYDEPCTKGEDCCRGYECWVSKVGKCRIKNLPERNGDSKDGRTKLSSNPASKFAWDDT